MKRATAWLDRRLPALLLASFVLLALTVLSRVVGIAEPLTEADCVAELAETGTMDAACLYFLGGDS